MIPGGGFITVLSVQVDQLAFKFSLFFLHFSNDNLAKHFMHRQSSSADIVLNMARSIGLLFAVFTFHTPDKKGHI